MKNKYSKIYIIGSVASEKSSLARELSRRLGILCYSLDDIIWDHRTGGNVKRTPQQRDEAFNQITRSGKWIIEDVLRPCFSSGLKRADLIVLLDMPARKNPILSALRSVGHVFRFRKWNRAPAVQALKSAKGPINFKHNIPAFLKSLEPYREKVVVLKDQNDVRDLYAALM